MRDLIDYFLERPRASYWPEGEASLRPVAVHVRDHLASSKGGAPIIAIELGVRESQEQSISSPRRPAPILEAIATGEVAHPEFKHWFEVLHMRARHIKDCCAAWED